MDFVPIDLENSRIIGEMLGTWREKMLLVERAKVFHWEIILLQDRCIRDMAEIILGKNHLPVSKGCQ